MDTTNQQRPPLPPFTHEDAIKKVRMAEDAWNTREPDKVSLAYTPDSVWRNRVEFLQGRDEIVEFLTRKWRRELEYRLIKEIWAFTDARIADRQRPVVSVLRQRKLGVRRAWPDGPTHSQHQRPAHSRGRSQVPLATRTAAGRSSGTVRAWSMIERSPPETGVEFSKGFSNKACPGIIWNNLSRNNRRNNRPGIITASPRRDGGTR